jgi:hypothetical protein
MFFIFSSATENFHLLRPCLLPKKKYWLDLFQADPCHFLLEINQTFLFSCERWILVFWLIRHAHWIFPGETFSSHVFSEQPQSFFSVRIRPMLTANLVISRK